MGCPGREGRQQRSGPPSAGRPSGTPDPRRVWGEAVPLENCWLGDQPARPARPVPSAGGGAGQHDLPQQKQRPPGPTCKPGRATGSGGGEGSCHPQNPTSRKADTLTLIKRNCSISPWRFTHNSLFAYKALYLPRELMATQGQGRTDLTTSRAPALETPRHGGPPETSPPRQEKALPAARLTVQTKRTAALHECQPEGSV